MSDTQRDIIIQIGKRLTHITREDLSQAEESICEILVEHEYADWFIKDGETVLVMVDSQGKVLQ